MHIALVALTVGIDFTFIIRFSVDVCKITYLLLLSSNQILPFVYWLPKVYRVHGDLDLANDIMLTETIKVKHLQHQSLTSQVIKWYLEKGKKEKGEKKRLNSKVKTLQTLQGKVDVHADQFKHATDDMNETI